jgi:iron(III) transport system substrate-binding protein
MIRIFSFLLLTALQSILAPQIVQAQTAILNLYSARHYQTDEALYSNFTKATGIKVQRIEAGDEALLARLRSEGANSPADIILLTDASRLWKAQTEGLFQPLQSQTLERRIPVELRSRDTGKGSDWFGFSKRARMIVYDKSKISADQLTRYEDLANPTFKGQICVRSASHPYMLSLIGSIIEHQGEAATETWARGVVANLARVPRGGDTDQIKGVAAGECAIALTNSYYFVRMLRSKDPSERESAQKLGIIWPNQANRGTHVNIAGGGIARFAPHRDAAVRFLEYLASDAAQSFFAEGNNEWPVVTGVALNNPELEALGTFKQDALSVERIGQAQGAAQRLIDRAGWR